MSGSGTSSCASWQSVVSIALCGRTWRMERAADLEALWDQMDVFNEDERIPYWTEIWPSSLVLGDWLYSHRNELAGRQALDMGCGIGLTALIGSWLGARVIGMDYEPEALRFARINALHNGVPQPAWIAMDWRKPALKARSMPFVWAGDIMYEQRFARPILDFLDHVLAPKGYAWIAEPCRQVYDTFRAMVIGQRWGCRCVHETTTPALYPQERPVPVRIWEISR